MVVVVVVVVVLVVANEKEGAGAEEGIANAGFPVVTLVDGAGAGAVGFTKEKPLAKGLLLALDPPPPLLVVPEDGVGLLNLLLEKKVLYKGIILRIEKL